MHTNLESTLTTPLTTDYDVIISGAGPVGLFLAGELALAHCTVLILEKAAQPITPLKQLPFGMRGLSAPTIEALYRRGLLPALELHQHVRQPHVTAPAAQGQPIRRQVAHFAGIPLFEDHIDPTQWKHRLPGDTPTSLLSSMEEIETILTRRATALGVTIWRGLALEHFYQSAAGVTVQAGDQTIIGKYLVGCDGSRSMVRKLGGFTFAGTEPTFTGYSVQADIAKPSKLLPGRQVTATGMYLQSQPGYLIIQDFDGGAFHQAGKPVTLSHVQAVLRRISQTDVIINALHIATTWTDHARQATTYRNGRVLIAGDAAHIHAPLGGQGLNLGLGDAMNLGWKLAATIQGKAPEGLLDSYCTERHPIGAAVLDWSRAQVAIMHPDPAASALRAIVRDLTDTRDGATYIAARLWGIFNHYQLDGQHPLTGYSVPNFELEDGGIHIGTLLQEGQGLLLDFEGNASLKQVADEYGHALKYITGPAKKQLGLSAVLVRPDGVIAWAAASNPDVATLQQAAARWFVMNGTGKS
ncbi:2-polyprenyl-6-methoxyphenol hydroxylase [Chitinophaga costaii]|uniref:2-polyprenyl-6-methoxyphenol hydroxylase n=1 Tax=Chitinophaga costaii TaxID=1335309 RepID=A0A1C4F1Z9_9BACT|nr:FAD-dependent monooxygenase [Chitinophaga costaii]PUZ22152.1 FAD-dependent oxidoreductase [Chitinophaga costaii]SCC49713.1 2-polyprenyl-6-methoxyphenol hydroxylase [Chitinophaga costaii]